jgi:hypothetical protein
MTAMEWPHYIAELPKCRTADFELNHGEHGVHGAFELSVLNFNRIERSAWSRASNTAALVSEGHGFSRAVQATMYFGFSR